MQWLDTAACPRWAPQMLSVLRMAVASKFMANGAQKLFNYPPSPYQMSHLPPLMTRGVWSSCGVADDLVLRNRSVSETTSIFSLDES